jgi:hypothetical protein
MSSSAARRSRSRAESLLGRHPLVAAGDIGVGVHAAGVGYAAIVRCHPGLVMLDRVAAQRARPSLVRGHSLTIRPKQLQRQIARSRAPRFSANARRCARGELHARPPRGATKGLTSSAARLRRDVVVVAPPVQARRAWMHPLRASAPASDPHGRTAPCNRALHASSCLGSKPWPIPRHPCPGTRRARSSR